jgi:hypothetical protein
MFSPANAIRRAYYFLAEPNWRKFFIYLGVLWILNAADVWQTMALKYSGQLATEANRFIDHFLMKGPMYFVIFKGLAVFLVSLMLIRGYFDKNGIKVGEASFSANQVRTAIQFLLVLAIVYYLIVVYLPLLIVAATFNPEAEVPYA